MSLFTFLGVLTLLFTTNFKYSESSGERLAKRENPGVKVTELDSWTLPRRHIKENDSPEIRRFRLETDMMSVEIMSLDLIITSIKLPDENKKMSEVILGFDDVSKYLQEPSFSGAFVSLSKGDMSKEDKSFRNWIPTVKDDRVLFSLLSGKDALLNAEIFLSNEEQLNVVFKGIVAKPLFLNVALKNYINLAGFDSGLPGLQEHVVQINANEIFDKNVGKYSDLEGNDLDLRIPQSLGSLIHNENVTLGRHYVVERSVAEYDRFVTRVSHSNSRRFLEIYSNQPAVYFNLLKKKISAESDEEVLYEAGFEMKTETLLDNEEFATIYPGEVYKHSAIYKFGIDQF